MKTVMLDLLALQSLLSHGGVPKLESLDAIAQLRSRIPQPILDRFDRLTAHSQRAVAIVSHGTCGECHMRLPIAAYANLVNPREVVICETCGCYLVLSPEEMPVQNHSRAARKTAVA